MGALNPLIYLGCKYSGITGQEPKIYVNQHLWRQLDVFQVAEESGNAPWERILSDKLRIHAGFREQPEWTRVRI
jgi:hypothetical protein